MKNNRRRSERRSHLQSLENRKLLAAAVLDISVENLAPDGGLALTPAYVAFHDGTFQIARSGRPVDEFPGFEELAEDGIVSGLEARFDSTQPDGVDAVLGAPEGFAGAPVIEPGETAIAQINVTDSEINRYFSYASMVIPSNDAFIANLRARELPVFDRLGRFTGPITFDVFGRNVYDAGSEVNNPTGGAAFSTGNGTAVDENGVVRPHEGLDDFISTGLPTGSDLDSAFDSSTPIARITISLADTEPQRADRSGPIAVAGNVASADAGFVDFQVSYSDPAGVDVSTIDANDLVVVGRRGQRFDVVSVTSSEAVDSDATQVTATYRIAKPDGSGFNVRDNGTYRVFLNRRQVSDTEGNLARRSEVGSFQVNIAQQLEVTIENLADPGGLTLTPLWVGFHDGNFDLGNAGESADNFGGLEEIAEEGATGVLQDRFAAEASGVDAVLTAPGGFGGAPVIEPGEVSSATLQVADPRMNPYFSYASMIIPSNDAFIGNLNEREFRVFDAHGRFRRPVTIYVFGDDIYDAGTEVNNANDGGAAFAVDSGTGVTENGVIAPHEGLDSFIGVALPPGTQLEQAFAGRTPIAKITIGRPGGAVASENRAPTVSAVTVPTVTSAAPVDVVLDITDPSGVDISELQASDLIVIGPRRVRLAVTDLTLETPSSSNPKSIRATFRVEGADGTFSAEDNGNYRVILARQSIQDGNGVANRNLNVGTLSVNLPS